MGDTLTSGTEPLLNWFTSHSILH